MSCNQVALSTLNLQKSIGKSGGFFVVSPAYKHSIAHLGAVITEFCCKSSKKVAIQRDSCEVVAARF